MGTPGNSLTRVEALFADWLAASRGAAPVAFEAFVARHAADAEALRALKGEWDRLQSILRHAGLEGRRSLEDLRARFGSDVDPGISLQGEAPQPEGGSGPSSELLARLRTHAPPSSRYRILGEVGRGGMGAVLKIWDEDLRRASAMKVVLGRDEASSGTPAVDARTLGRFLEEAQITGQLDHPGIVPVHELGLGSDGRVYFTMRLVKGEDLRTVFGHVQTGHDGWNPTRALSVLLKVCEAMAYAHDKKVIHRDLKPANVMVGRYGEVYVMDWGLARVLGEKDRHDLRLRTIPATSQSMVATERRAERDETPDSPLVTMDGTVMGTPAYMPPEQARGELEALGPHSDVYALGAMLYELLTGQMPYVPAGALVSPRVILARLIEEPPRSLASLAPRAPAELVAICEKAMAREPKARYRDMTALADDLRAYLERRVVKAYESGTWAETKKWVQRNKPLAASIAGIVLVAAAGALAFARKAAEAKERELEAQHQSQLAAEKSAELSESNRKLAESNRELLASSREARIRGLIQELEYFDSLDDDFYAYARHQTRPAHEWWIEDARRLLDGIPDGDPDGRPWSPGLADVRQQLAELRARAAEAAERGTFRFERSDDEWWHRQLVRLEEGLVRLGAQLEVAERSVHAPENAALWSEAIAAIAASPRYGGLRLTPQLGLVPIGADPDSGLWEFAHLATGDPAQRGADRKLVLRPEMGMVLVLLPGGRVPVAAKASDGQDASLTKIELDPFFLSKYEMTQAQWSRIGGWERSGRAERTPSLMPASDLSWDDCQVALQGNAGWLRLPSEAQWEFGCRSGTATTWWTGDDPEELRGVANIDFDTKDGTSGDVQPIGGLLANFFGLHDVHGNLWEWCQDAFFNGSQRRVGDGLSDELGAAARVLRGGGGWSEAASARSSYRHGNAPDIRNGGYGLRPARGITP